MFLPSIFLPEKTIGKDPVYVGKDVSDDMIEEYREAKLKRAQYRRLRAQVRGQIRFIRRALCTKQSA